MAESQEDLGEGFPNANGLVITAETREDPMDRQHRHAQEVADAELRRWKDKLRFGIASLLFVSICGISAYFATAHTATPDERLWGRTTLVTICSAVGGYFIGKSGKE